MAGQNGTPDGLPATMTVEEASKRLGVSRNTGYEAVRLNQIPSIRIGRRILVPRAALERILAYGSQAA